MIFELFLVAGGAVGGGFLTWAYMSAGQDFPFPDDDADSRRRHPSGGWDE